MRTPFTRIGSENEGDAESAKVILREKLERCTFCNSRLVFTHDLNINILQVIETGRCPGCGVTMLPRKYTLQ